MGAKRKSVIKSYTKKVCFFGVGYRYIIAKKKKQLMSLMEIWQLGNTWKSHNFIWPGLFWSSKYNTIFNVVKRLFKIVLIHFALDGVVQSATSANWAKWVLWSGLVGYVICINNVEQLTENETRGPGFKVYNRWVGMSIVYTFFYNQGRMMNCLRCLRNIQGC